MFFVHNATTCRETSRVVSRFGLHKMTINDNYHAKNGLNYHDIIVVINYNNDTVMTSDQIKWSICHI